MMSPFLLRRFQSTEVQRREVMSLLNALSASQRAGKKAGGWSPLQIAEHLVLSYETVGSRERAKIEREASGKTPRSHPVRLQLVLWAMRRGMPLPLPSPAVDPAGAIEWPQLQVRWERASSSMRESLEAPGAAHEPPVRSSHRRRAGCPRDAAVERGS